MNGSMKTGYTSAWMIKPSGNYGEMRLGDVNRMIDKIYSAGGQVESVARDWASGGIMRIVVSYSLPVNVSFDDEK